jgi:hypothetical protein
VSPSCLDTEGGSQGPNAEWVNAGHSSKAVPQEDWYLTVGSTIVLTPQEVAKLVRRTERRTTRPRGPLAQPR